MFNNQEFAAQLLLGNTWKTLELYLLGAKANTKQSYWFSLLVHFGQITILKGFD